MSWLEILVWRGKTPGKKRRIVRSCEFVSPVNLASYLHHNSIYSVTTVSVIRHYLLDLFFTDASGNLWLSSQKSGIRWPGTGAFVIVLFYCYLVRHCLISGEWRQDSGDILSHVSLFLVDEVSLFQPLPTLVSIINSARLHQYLQVHILHETRGATLEVCISRMKTRTRPRFVLLSATVPNIEDIASWIRHGDPPHPTSVFRASVTCLLFLYHDLYL